MSSDRAYMAGLFDGEGWVGVTTTRREQNEYMTLRASFTNTHQSTVLWVGENFGGRVIALGTPEGGTRAAWRIDWASADAVEFLRSVRPWLRIKADQVDAALQWPLGAKGRSLTEPVLVERTRLRDLLKDLKAGAC